MLRRQGARGMKAKIKWLDGRAFVGESGSGHAVVMDGAPEAGGRNIGIRPMEMLLIGLGACTAFDVVMILEKGREKVTSCEIELDGDRAAGRAESFHPCEDDLPPEGQEPQARRRRARHQALRGKILLRHRHVPPHRKDRT